MSRQVSRPYFNCCPCTHVPLLLLGQTYVKSGVNRSNVFQFAAVEERAERIVESAVALAEKGGFEAVRLRDVAADAGVALGTLYRHFRSKEDLLVAALAAEVTTLEDYLSNNPARGGKPIDRVVSVFAVATSGMCRRPRLAQAILKSVASANPDLTEQVAAFHGRIAALTDAALHGPETRSNGNDHSAEALVLQQVWFASLVGWAGGLHDQEAVVSKVRVAAGFVLG